MFGTAVTVSCTVAQEKTSVFSVSRSEHKDKISPNKALKLIGLPQKQ